MTVSCGAGREKEGAAELLSGVSSNGGSGGGDRQTYASAGRGDSGGTVVSAVHM